MVMALASSCESSKRIPELGRSWGSPTNTTVVQSEIHQSTEKRYGQRAVQKKKVHWGGGWRTSAMERLCNPQNEPTELLSVASQFPMKLKGDSATAGGLACWFSPWLWPHRPQAGDGGWRHTCLVMSLVLSFPASRKVKWSNSPKALGEPKMWEGKRLNWLLELKI